jgi:hypothetical protein
VKSVRDSISVYNRRPTIVPGQLAPHIESPEETEKKLLEQALAAKQADQMEEYDDNKSKVLEAIKRVEVKLSMLNKRIEKRNEQGLAFNHKRCVFNFLTFFSWHS